MRLGHLLGKVVFSLLLLLSLPWVVQAQSDGQAAPMWLSFVRALAALLFVLALFFLLVYAVRKYFPRLMAGATGESPTGKIELLASRSLGPKKHLYLIRVKGVELLIGTGENGMSNLARWRDGELETTDDPSNGMP